MVTAKRLFILFPFFFSFLGMWFSDGPRTQQRLAVDLAALLDVMPDDAAVMPFLDAFWKTMAREWNGIDVLRMNKFLFLVRAYLGASFRYLARRGGKGGGGDSGEDDGGAWRASAVRAHNAVLRATPLSAADGKVPNGLRYHVLDVFVDELEKAGALEVVDDDANPSRRRGNGRDEKEGDEEEKDDKEDEGGEGEAAGNAAPPPVELLQQPVRELSEQSPTKAVRRRAREILADERLARCLQQQRRRRQKNGPSTTPETAAWTTTTTTSTSTRRRAIAANGSDKDNRRAQAEADEADVAADEEEEWNGFDD